MMLQPPATRDAPSPTKATPGAATIEWSQSTRRPRQIWHLAGFGDRPQALWCAVYLIRPPLVSNSTVPVVAQITEPLSAGRRALVLGGLLVTGAATGAMLVSQPLVAAAMIVLLLAVAAAVSTRALHGGVDPDHVRLHDIVASERHSGDGERSLRSLLDSVDTGIEIDVDHGRPGLVAMYVRLGFDVRESPNRQPDRIRMLRPARTTTPVDLPGGTP